MKQWYDDYCIDNIQSVLGEINKYDLWLDHDDLSMTKQLDHYYRTLDRLWDSLMGPTRYVIVLYKPVQVGQASGYHKHLFEIELSPRYV
jgi:RNAse (barnase) inhibitor barstar